jgi:hypothetical protein
VTSHAFVLVLLAAAALLAMWILARYTAFGPRSLLWAAVHTIIACVLLRLVPFALDVVSGSGIPAVQYVQVFGVALPLLVYGFLSGGWITRIALELLRP